MLQALILLTLFSAQPRETLELSLGGGGVDLELWNMELRIVYPPQGDSATLLVWHREPITRAVSPERFLTTMPEGWTRIERRDAEDEQAPRLLAELRLGRGQKLRLVGDALDIEQELIDEDFDEGAIAEAPAFGQPSGGESASEKEEKGTENVVFGLELALEASRVVLSRTDSSSIWIRNTRLDLLGGQGELVISASDRADLTFESPKGQVIVVLESDSQARIRNAGAVKVDSQRSSVEIDGAQKADLKLRDSSQLILMGQLPAAVIQLIDSEMKSSGGELSGRPKLVLEGTSSARVELRAPCFVRVEQQGSLYGSQATVNGCELASPDSRMRGRNRQSLLPTTQLVVTLGKESYLEVDGS